jgi:phenylalanyl-tRNA synthetase alpha chain
MSTVLQATKTVDAAALARALALRDLTDPAAGPHAMQLLIERITDALTARWGCALLVKRAPAIVSVADNYDRLHVPPDAAARDAKYTRYVSAGELLRTHTTATIPAVLAELARKPEADVLIACPGLCYRRDAIDRLHTGEPHQLDLWRVTRGWLTTTDLDTMIDTVVRAVLPAARYRVLDAVHAYTVRGRQVELWVEGRWVEILECGIALPALLREAGLAEPYSGLAMGIGLDRLLMLVKGIADIRLLRTTDPRVAGQMLDLARYRAVSDQPAVRRDLSIAVAEDTTTEEIGDRVRTALGDDIDALEAVEMLSETSYAGMTATAIARIGMRPGQKNVLVRLVIRHLSRTLSSEEANVVRDRVYAAIHQGDIAQWASPSGD